MTNEKLEVAQAELGTVHTSIEKLVGVLISAKRKCEQDENHKLRVEIKANQGKVADLQKMHCQLAQQELALRYLELEQRLEQERGTREGMVLQESSVTSQLAAIQAKITAFDCAPSWQLSGLVRQVKKIVAGPLRRALETKLAAEQQAHQAAVDQAVMLEGQLKTVKGELSESATQEVALKAELEKLLALGETHHRVIRGSPQEIRAVLREDSRIVVDRWAAEKLICKWEEGFVEVLDQTDFLQPDQVVAFVVTDAVIAYWFDTGEVAGSEIMWATAPDHVWSKSHHGLSLKLTAESLELKRRAQEAQPVSA
jgi:hypothetical protein